MIKIFITFILIYTIKGNIEEIIEGKEEKHGFSSKIHLKNR